MGIAANRQADFLWPLQWRVSPVQAFVEIPILGNGRYTSIEIQRLRNGNGSGLVAILHRTDDTVDVYFESILALDDEWRRSDPAVSHLRMGALEAVTFASRILEISVDSIDCNVIFRDINQTLIKFRVLQKRGWGSRVRQFVPMPVEATASVLRLLLLDCFCMLRRRGTLVDVYVGEDRCIPATFALPLGFSRRYSGRFSGPVLLAGLNPNGTYPFNTPTDFHLNEKGSLVSVRVGDTDLWFETVFEPALPRPDVMVENDTLGGTMTIRSPLGNVTSANWVLRSGSSDASPELSLENVSQHWLPSLFNQPALSVLARLRWFKRRGIRLAWTGRFAGSLDHPIMHSTWSSNGHWREQI